MKSSFGTTKIKELACSWTIFIEQVWSVAGAKLHRNAAEWLIRLEKTGMRKWEMVELVTAEFLLLNNACIKHS